MITIDFTMPLHIINILLLTVILNIVLYRPIRNILDKRREKISALGGDIEKFETNRLRRLEEFEHKLQEARSKAKSEFDATRAATQAESGAKLTALRQEVESSKNSQLKEIESQFAAAQTELRGQIDGFAQVMAAKVLGRAI